MIGQWAHFASSADGNSGYALNRYLKETIRLLQVLNVRLSETAFLAGDDYSISDMMSYPWVIGGLHRLKSALGSDLPDFPSVERWLAGIQARPAVQRALQRLDSCEDALE